MEFSSLSGWPGASLGQVLDRRSAQRRGAERVGETAAPDDDAPVPPQVHTGGGLVVLVALIALEATKADEVVVKGVALPVGLRHGQVHEQVRPVARAKVNQAQEPPAVTRVQHLRPARSR